MKLILLILALAAYGAYSLSARFQEASLPAVGAQESTITTGGPTGLANLSDRAFSYGAEVAGLSWQPMDPVGCQNAEALTPDRLNALIDSIPVGPQRDALAQLLAKLPQVPLQLYQGSAGTGLCISAMNRMVLLPQNLPQSLPGLPGISQ